MKKFDKVVNIITDWVAYASMVAVAVMMFLNVADVFASKIGGSSISGAYEITECSLMCAIFLALAYGQTQKTHVHMTLFISKLPGRTKFIPFFLGNALSMLMSILLTYATITQTRRQLADNTVTGILYIPYFPFYVIAVIGMIAFDLALAYDVILSFLAMFKDEFGELVSSHW